ncbi:MarR family winged helix-turn-helix transcriptional regulator [Clostridium sp.]|uniref:MarR family winged helix-turn-helix transcriptional regulator n=1 Tax=Clostridium sp. TaxID=1506 RepID=UPI002FDEAC16
MKKNTLDLLRQFARIEWLLHRYYQKSYKHHGPMGDPHRGQGRVLALLKLKPEISQKDLSNILDMRSQSLGELLAKLERNGHITRTPSEKDGRVMDIHLTEEGKKASEQNEQESNRETLFKCLTEEEETVLSNYLARIISELEQQFGNNELKSGFSGNPHFEGRRAHKHFHIRGGHSHFCGKGLGKYYDINSCSFSGEGDFHQNFHNEDKRNSPDNADNDSNTGEENKSDC